MRFRSIGTYSPEEHTVRLCRFIWGDGFRMLSLGLRPQLCRWRRSFREWRLTLLGLALHYRANGGGRFA